MKNSIFILAMAVAITITGCAGMEAKDIAKKAESTVYNEMHRIMSVFCMLPEPIRTEEIQELSRDIWQRGYGEDDEMGPAGSEAFVMWIYCPDTLDIDWNEDRFGPLPEIDTTFIKDTGWEPGECPSEHTDYGCPSAELEKRKAARDAEKQAKREAEEAARAAEAEAAIETHID